MGQPMKKLLKCSRCKSLITLDEAALAREIVDECDGPMCLSCARELVAEELDSLAEVRDEDEAEALPS